jgi:ribonuclease HI
VSDAATTNNRMALRSVIDSLGALTRKGRSFRVVFCTDSRYIVDGMTRWVGDWIQRGWKRKAGPIENLELWQLAVGAAAQHMIQWRWVRGHAGHAQNEYANDLAVRAASTLGSSHGLVASSFEEWAASRKGRHRAVAPEAFPEARTFRPSPRLPDSGTVSP